MANRGPSFGLSREVKLKLAAKYDKNLEDKQKEWISTVTGITLPDFSFRDILKDGILLCTLADRLIPGTVKKPFPHTKLLNSFRCMENIQAYLDIAHTHFGVPVASLFQTCDLYDSSNMTQVQICIQAFASAATSKGLTTCDFAIKVATKEKRVWSQAKLKAGEGIIGLQMGSNTGANQRGMSFGTPRPLYDKKYTGLGEQAADNKYVNNYSNNDENISISKQKSHHSSSNSFERNSFENIHENEDTNGN